VDGSELKQRCLALPGAQQEFPFGDEVSVFQGRRQDGRGGPPWRQAAAVERQVRAPELAASPRATYPAIAPGYQLNKRHWKTITLDGSLRDEMVADLLGDPYDLVVASLPKARRPA
jgi:predicted DNA-binding protein (MmcQ/YjbR family)